MENFLLIFSVEHVSYYCSLSNDKNYIDVI